LSVIILRSLRAPTAAVSFSASFSCAFFLFLMLRPPRSPLFPYTTLFRSRRHPAAPLGRSRRHSERHRHRGLEPIRRPVLADGFQDRKSTRLNSSHGSISYAVFCLKKKKNEKARSLSCSYGRHQCVLATFA